MMQSNTKFCPADLNNFLRKFIQRNCNNLDRRMLKRAFDGMVIRAIQSIEGYRGHADMIKTIDNERQTTIIYLFFLFLQQKTEEQATK